MDSQSAVVLSFEAIGCWLCWHSIPFPIETHINMFLHQMLLLGGDPIYRNGLTTTLRSHLPEIGISAVVGTTYSIADFHSYSLIVFIDEGKVHRKMKSPLKRLMETCSKTGKKVIVFGDYLPMKYGKKLLIAGVSGYLLKGASETEAIKVFRGVLRGEKMVDATLKSRWVNEALGCSRSNFYIRLTKRERQVLQLIVEEHTSQEIASELFISHCTVESHRANIMGKLGVRNVAGLVREAVRRDLCEVA